MIVLGSGDDKIKGILLLELPYEFFGGGRTCFGDAVVDDELGVPGAADSVVVILGERYVEEVDETIERWWGML